MQYPFHATTNFSYDLNDSKPYMKANNRTTKQRSKIQAILQPKNDCSNV